MHDEREVKNNREKDPGREITNKKTERLIEENHVDNKDKKMTTNQGLKISEDEFSLTAGDRGPTLMEDFHLREKITHFDHERIPERIVHARGTGAHGVFRVYESQEEFTKAKFLCDPSLETPVFVRFSTVAGSRGSADNVRDVRGFAVKFYTDEGNYDLVSNNIPVFFIQDAVKFPDFIHALKPEPHTEIPQAASAHDTFWDFLANNRETAHMMMWSMSDRTIPSSLRKMEGFGVNTFRWINKDGVSHFVKYHWKPRLGVHSKVWDEAQKTNGKDPDFHRRDLIEAIETGNYPVWELGVQILREDEEFSLDFDILDPTKLWPEEEVPVKIIGEMVLNRNVDNFFAETEQVAFHPGHLVPGIDFTNDPLLQGRLFSYTDTQISRLGGPNFHQIPINRPIAPVHNNQRDAMHQMEIHEGQTSYHKNSLMDNSPSTADEKEGGFSHYQEKVEGNVIKNRSESFKDFYSQARMFYKSLSPAEQRHMKDAFAFELMMVESESIRQQVTEMVAEIDRELAGKIAEEIGTKVPEGIEENAYGKISPALSQESTPKLTDTLKVAVWITDGFDHREVTEAIKKIKDAKAVPEIISSRLGEIKGEGGNLKADKTYLNAASCLYDAALMFSNKAEMSDDFRTAKKEFASDTFNHCKPLGSQCPDLLGCEEKNHAPGVTAGEGFSVDKFMDDLKEIRFFDRVK